MNIELTNALYGLIIYGGFLASYFYLYEHAHLADKHPRRILLRPIPRVTLFLFLLIAVPSFLQALYPNLLYELERNYGLIRHGELWRLVTPLFVQDGGFSGTAFNLVSLLLIGAVAEKLWGARRLLTLFFLCGMLVEIIAFYWQPIGAGNSGANFGIAAATVVLCLKHTNDIKVRILCWLVIAAGLVLLWQRNIHGIAVIIGASIGFLLSQGATKTLRLRRSSH